MQDALQIFFQSVDFVICASWLVLLAVNFREVSSYKDYLLSPAEPTGDYKVSVVIPARNEEKRITSTIESVLRQSVKSLEVIVVDDRSTDSTPQIVQQMQINDSRIELVRGGELPPGWTGKNWACHQGFAQSHGDWILFIDSDTRIEPSAVASSLEYSKTRGLQALSLIPRTEYSGLLGRAVGPAVSWLIRLGYPLRKVNDPSKKVAVAVGGFIMLERSAYLEIGGHEAVRGELVEDKEIATKLKEHGLTYRLLVGRKLAVIGLFTGEQGVWNSLRRIITNPLKRGRWSKMFLAVVGLLLLLFPTVFLLANLFAGQTSIADIVIAGVSLTSPIALVGYDASGMSPPRLRYALLATLGGIIVMLAIARQIFGAEQVGWRGRNYVPQ